MTQRIYGNATVLVGRELKAMENARIVVENGILEHIDSGSAQEGVDLKGALVFPSFVDAHTHIADSGIKDAVIGLPTAQAVSPPDGLKYRYLAEMTEEQLGHVLKRAIRELLANGIGAFADFREGGADGVTALRRVVSQQPILSTILGDPVCAPWDEEYMEEIVDVVACADGIGIGDIERYSGRQLDALSTLLAGNMSVLAIHTAETQDAQDACMATWNCSEVIRALACGADLLVHLTNPLAGDIAAIREAEIPVVCCARTNAIIADGLPPVAELHAAGVCLALGTDNMMLTSPNMFREMDWFSRLIRAQSRDAGAITSRDVLSIATLGGARALGISDNMGTLEVGKAASFVGINPSSANLIGTRNIHAAIVHRAGPQDISLVVSQGEEVINQYRGAECTQ